MNDHLEDDLTAMLARRAATNPVTPDLDRVVADADGPGHRPVRGGGGRGPYVLSLAAALIVVVGAGLFAIRSVDRTTVPAGEPVVSTTQGSDTVTVETSSPPSSDQPPLTPTHTFEEPTTTLGCDGPGPTNVACGADDDGLVSTTLGCEGPGPTNTECSADPGEEQVPTTLGCDGPGPTNTACDGDPDTIFTRCFSDTTDTTRCCTNGTTTICQGAQITDPPDAEPIPTQPQPTTSVDPADCVQVTTVPGCESLHRNRSTLPPTSPPTVTPTTAGPVESVTISTTAPAG